MCDRLCLIVLRWYQAPLVTATVRRGGTRQDRSGGRADC
jgi:hypothetical protein